MATETRELTCINCPLGCQLTVTIVDGEVVYDIMEDTAA